MSFVRFDFWKQDKHKALRLFRVVVVLGKGIVGH